MLKEAAKKAGPLRKKELFLKLFFILLTFKNKNYFILDNLSKYGHITLKFVGRYFFFKNNFSNSDSYSY